MQRWIKPSRWTMFEFHSKTGVGTMIVQGLLMKPLVAQFGE
jgi:hypothetical protein